MLILSRRFIRSSIIIIFVLAMGCTVTNAGNSSISVNVGALNDAKEFEATFVISDNPGFASFQLNVEYDVSFMNPISVQQGHVLYDGIMNTNLSNVLDEPNIGSVTIYFVNNVNIVGNGELFKVRFKITDTANGTSKIKLKYQDGNFIDQSFEELQIKCIEGQISVDILKDESSPEPLPTPTVTDAPEQSQTTTHSSGDGDDINFVVSYETNGGSRINDTPVGRGKVLVKPPAPLKDGFVFKAWYLDAELTEKYDFSIAVTKSFTLYAKWQEVSQFQTWINPFKDVQTSDWFYSDVEYVVINGLFQGISTAVFEPNTAMSRAMFVTVLWRLADSPIVDNSPFSDVEDEKWFTNAVAWASVNRIVNGVSNDLFAPDDYVTREQMAAILYRYEQFSGKYPPNTQEDKEFADGNSISNYAKNPVNILVTQGIINGKPHNMFDPQGKATRAEVSTMLHRFIEAVK